MKNIAVVIKQWRWASKLTVRETAKILHTSPATVSRFERGENIDGETQGRIIIWLLSEVTAPSPAKENAK